MSLDDNDSCRVTPLEYRVEFPTPKGFGLRVKGGNLAHGLTMSSIENIGGDVGINMGDEILATVSYREALTPDFTLDGYEQRAKKHAQGVIDKIIKAALQQAACEGFENLLLHDSITNKHEIMFGLNKNLDRILQK